LATRLRSRLMVAACGSPNTRFKDLVFIKANQNLHEFQSKVENLLIYFSASVPETLQLSLAGHIGLQSGRD
jgi:hypothetical protein